MTSNEEFAMIARPFRHRRRTHHAVVVVGLAFALALGPLSTVPGAADPVADAAAHAEANAGAWSQRSAAGMTVELYRPTTPAALPAGRALMISLHGCVQTAQDLKAGGNWTQTADEYGMVVAVPAAPNGGVLLGCWDYYDTNHSRSDPARHDDNLLALVDALLADTSLGIDPDQVYVTGLSSGGAQAMVMGCLAPDVFAGVGIDAGPTVGTTSAQIGSVATTLAEGRSVCTTFAGSHADAFGSQVTSVVYGSADTTVARGYNPLNAEIMAELYGAGSSSDFSLAELPGTNTSGSGTLYSDAEGARVSLIENTGVGHAWPAGGGPGGSYISTNSIDYPAYVTEFLFETNRRVDRDDPGPDPDLTAPDVAITAPADGATVSGTVPVAVDATDDVAVDRVEVSVGGVQVGTADTVPYEVAWDTSSTAAGEREVTARAIDTSGNAANASVTVTVVQGPGGDTCTTAANSEHEAAGRAISYGVDPHNPYYATGSLDYLGQGDATVTSLRETSPGWFDMVAAC